MARYAKFFSVGGGGGGTNNLQLPVGTVLDTTLRQVQDGLGTGSALYISTRRVGITSDPSVTTQTSSVIQATTTNANLVIAPNGTGALVASIPDGTATGGNARGANAVDLQINRTGAALVASGTQSIVLNGTSNTASNNQAVVINGDQNIASAQQATIVNGSGNTASGLRSFIGNGFLCTASSNYSVVSGGQSNTASTNTHATVVGGNNNTSSGQYSVSGGTNNVASGQAALTIGYGNTASATWSVALGIYNQATAVGAVALGGSGSGAAAGTGGNIASAQGSFAVGQGSSSYLYGQNATAAYKFALNGDAQQSLLTARKSDTLTTGGTTTLSLDGTGTTNLIIPNGNNRMWNVQVRWVAVVTAITGTATGVTVGDTKTSTDLLAVAKRGGVTTVSAHTSAGTHAIETIAGSLTAANIAYTAGASQEMAITFTGPTFAGGGSVTMRVVAAISLTEVAYV